MFLPIGFPCDGRLGGVDGGLLVPHIDGPAVIEASKTTLSVPSEWPVPIDEHDISWIEGKGQQ